MAPGGKGENHELKITEAMACERWGQQKEFEVRKRFVVCGGGIFKYGIIQKKPICFYLDFYAYQIL
jgi:hypothetical protein